MSPLTLSRIVILGIILTALLAGSARAEVDEATRYLENSASLLGPTGWINIPSADIAGGGMLDAAIHNGQAKMNLGFFDLVEVGVYFQADQLGTNFEPYRDLSSMERIEENIPTFAREVFRPQAKLQLLDQDWGLVSLAGGYEDGDYYGVIQRYFRLSRVTLLAGGGTGRFKQGFVGFSKTIFSGAEVMFEYDGVGMNMGLRMLLAPNLILSLAGQNLNTVGEYKYLGEVIGTHFLFGITYVEKVW